MRSAKWLLERLKGLRPYSVLPSGALSVVPLMALVPLFAGLDPFLPASAPPACPTGPASSGKDQDTG
ncbi:hypothetical protein AN216_17490 [Streptomyces oceani]|uniref:Uncharacterized protein n=1 Tax=Streptomyces oceani TaxID=1075402 RepID=A0A1E7JZK7_9ACTN|nr:hypothetical protein AN216_17490 [Streptomyces oceani]